MEKIEKYEVEYSKLDFWKKVLDSIIKAGESVIEKALTLYYSAKDDDTPKWAKSVVFGALGYFILPTDAIPDFVPGVGYTDDYTVLIAAFTTVALHVKDVHKLKAKEKIGKISSQ